MNNDPKEFQLQKYGLDAALSASLEELAAVEHERWAHWQSYLHSKCERQADGSLIIPGELVRQWERLIDTPYEMLTEEEKESDRDQVHRYIPVLLKNLGAS